ncbi:hypothetical protein RCL1_008770 [Eukaryota sp. TZLM3-RCL]
MCKDIVFGSLERNYISLHYYLHELTRNNPDTINHFEVNNKKMFKRLFIAFGSALKGFDSCKPLITLDGTHLTSQVGGVLLAACASDALGRIFPLAISVVEVENKQEWLYFLENLKKCIPETAMILLSDRQNGLIEKVKTIFPGVHHGYCVKHLADNVSKRSHRKNLLEKVWEATRCLTQQDYEMKMADINAVSNKARDYLIKAGVEHWVTVFFPGTRFGYLTSNIFESLNSWLLTVRELPLIAMLEEIRLKLTKLIFERRAEAHEIKSESTQNVIEPVYLKLRENLAIGRTMRVLECGNANQQVMEVWENSRILLINWDFESMKWRTITSLLVFP